MTWKPIYDAVRCRQFELSVKFFCFVSTSFDRARAADHEKLLFCLSKCFLSVKKNEIFKGCQFTKKTNHFKNVPNFLLHSFLQALEIIFLDSASKIEYKKLLNRL
jgi:hypothetical protein